MSYVTTKFDVPHIFRYGMTDEDEGYTWQLFYRCGSVFSIDIRREDIAGTPFEEEWSKYCVEGDLGEYLDRWPRFCDFVIGHILPTLQRLAPAGGRPWTTLQDYLDASIYRLKLFKDEAVGDAVAEVMHGPLLLKIALPYDLDPQPSSRLEIPEDLPRIRASEVQILGHEKDWRQVPSRAQLTQSGEVASLMPAECAREAAETGIITNASLEAMAKMLELHKVKENINVPKPLALVTTEGRHDPEVKMAGLLYFGVPEDATRLADMGVEDLKDAHSQGLTSFWKEQIGDILKVLASYNMSHGSVHQFNIWIDSGTSAWLDSPKGSVHEGPFKEPDLERLNTVFDSWLKSKVSGE